MKDLKKNQDQTNEIGNTERRSFLKSSSVIALGGILQHFYSKEVFADQLDVVQGLPTFKVGLVLPPIPGGREIALTMFNAATSAQTLANAMKDHFGLEPELDRALLFSIPDATVVPPGIKIQDKASLLGESVYTLSLSDQYIQSYLKPEQLRFLGSSSFVQLSRDIGELVQMAGNRAIRSGCSSSTSSSCGCSSSSTSCSSFKKGDPIERSYVAAISFGKLTEESNKLYRGVIGLQGDNEAWAMVMQIEKEPEVKVLDITIGTILPDGSIHTKTFDSSELQEIGPENLVRKLYGNLG
jgi:hypothetical protein